MIRRPKPAAAGLVHLVTDRLRRDLRACPHMVEAAAAIRGDPVLCAVAPPGEATLGRWNEASAEVDPAMRCLKVAQMLHLDRRVADDVEQLLVAPDVAFERCDIEVADQPRR